MIKRQFVDEENSRTGEHLVVTNPSPVVPVVPQPHDHKVPSVLIADALTVVETSAHQFVAEQNS